MVLCFDVDHLAICLVLNLSTGLQLCLGEYAKGLVKFYCLVGSESRNCLYHGADVRKTASASLFYPRIGVTVAVEDDALVVAEQLLDHVMNCGIEVICLLQLICCLFEGLCHDGIQDYVCTERWNPKNQPYGTRNLLPVNANGEVRLRSVASLTKSGRVATPVLKMVPPLLEWVASPVLHS